MAEFDFLLKINLFRQSISEQKDVLNDFWAKGKDILSGTSVNQLAMPKEWASFKRNYFSVLFIAILKVLDIPPERLKLYARLNHCLRSWVTACDNLLDDELKEMILTDLPEEAKIFKSVHTLMVVDRIFFSFLIDAVKSGIISTDEMETLVKVSLSSISESGVEEASEEKGVDYKMSPEDVLSKVHYFKTGQLFASPLVAPTVLNDIKDKNKEKIFRDGLCNFGLGCQILDDLSDIGMDLYNRKHNYLISLIMNGENDQEKTLLLEMIDKGKDVAMKGDLTLYEKFPLASDLAKKEALSRLKMALEALSEGGLPLGKVETGLFINTLAAIMGHPKILGYLRV